MVIKGNKYKQKEKYWGQSLVEFALLLPLLLLLVIGAMDIGRIFYYKMVLTNAAREGANYLAYYPDDADNTYEAIEAEAENFNIDIDPNNEVDILGSCYSAGDCQRGDQIGVRVSKVIELVYGGILQSLGITGGPFNLNSTIWMAVQNDVQN